MAWRWGSDKRLPNAKILVTIYELVYGCGYLWCWIMQYTGGRIAKISVGCGCCHNASHTASFDNNNSLESSQKYTNCTCWLLFGCPSLKICDRLPLSTTWLLLVIVYVGHQQQYCNATPTASDSSEERRWIPYKMVGWSFNIYGHLTASLRWFCSRY